MVADPKCPLCLLHDRVLTKWHWVDELVIICDCLTCTKNGVEDHIMVVLRRHTAEPTEREADHMQAMADAAGIEITRKKARACPQHAHWHGRRKIRQ